MQKRFGLSAVALTAALLVTAAPAPSFAASQDFSAPTIQVAEASAPASSGGIRPMNDAEAASAGCIILGTASMGVTYAAGPSEAIMLIAGGILVPGPVASRMLIALTATLGAAACSMGAVLTPVALWAFGSDDGPGAQASASLGRARDSLARTLGFGDGTVQVADGAGRSR